MTYWGPLRDLPAKLTARARELESLVSMPHRVLSKDVEGASAALNEAADGMRQLMAGELPGCTCRRIDKDDYSYLNYDEKCRDHGNLWAQTTALKKRYEELHAKLTDELRIRIVSEVISSLAATQKCPSGLALALWAEDLAEQASAVADAAIAELGKARP